MRHREEEAMSGGLIAMIDIVFQIIIFFVCTANLQDSAVSGEIKLPLAPNAPIVDKKDPSEVNIDVDAKGRISIARAPVAAETLYGVLKKIVREQGQVPVVIRADGNTEHTFVKRAMDACSQSGIHKIKFAAIREGGG